MAATITDPRAVNGTLSTTTVDDACLTQFWDAVRVTNHDGTNIVYVTFDGSTPSAGAEGSYAIPVSNSRLFRGGTANVAGIPGSTTAATTCHRVKVVGSGGSYAVEGLAGASTV